MCSIYACTSGEYVYELACLSLYVWSISKTNGNLVQTLCGLVLFIVKQLNLNTDLNSINFLISFRTSVFHNSIMFKCHETLSISTNRNKTKFSNSLFHSNRFRTRDIQYTERHILVYGWGIYATSVIWVVVSCGGVPLAYPYVFCPFFGKKI